MTENPGGVESFLINYYRHVNKSDFQFDFLSNTDVPIAYEDELVNNGSRIFRTTPRSKSIFKFKKELNQIFYKHSSEWDAIWVNVCSLANVDYLKLAKRYGIKKRIIHSHNSQNMDSKLRGLIHNINKRKLDKWATDYWACSEEAALWFYNDRLIDKSVVIKNAIDVKRFEYDDVKRSVVREEIGVKDEFLIGNIGRLHFQKNQTFALDVFKEYLEVNPNSQLILIGEGEDREALKQKCESLDIQDKVIFTGLRKDINAWLSAFDVFLFPSLFEGLPIALLEAEASGVPVVGSENAISKEAVINDNIITLSLDSSPKDWAKQIEFSHNNYKRTPTDLVSISFKEKGFDITEQVMKVQKLLLKD